jgi:hypothetical protein
MQISIFDVRKANAGKIVKLVESIGLSIPGGFEDFVRHYQYDNQYDQFLVINTTPTQLHKWIPSDEPHETRYESKYPLIAKVERDQAKVTAYGEENFSLIQKFAQKLELIFGQRLNVECIEEKNYFTSILAFPNWGPFKRSFSNK